MHTGCFRLMVIIMAVYVPLAAARPTTQADRASSNALTLFRRIIDSANTGAEAAHRLDASDLDSSYADLISHVESIAEALRQESSSIPTAEDLEDVKLGEADQADICKSWADFATHHHRLLISSVKRGTNHQNSLAFNLGIRIRDAQSELEAFLPRIAGLVPSCARDVQAAKDELDKAFLGADNFYLGDDI